MAKGVPETHPEERQALNWSPKKNWVEKRGGLPSYINSVAVALVRGGMPRERAIPTAVNVVKKTCATGLWGGRPKAKVSPAIKAAACKAAAEWEAKKGANLSTCADCSRTVELAGPVTTTAGTGGGTVTTNALLKPPKQLKPRHLKALARANANLAKAGMPKSKRRRVMKSMVRQMKQGKRVSLSHPVELAFNPSQLRVSAGGAGGGQWTLGMVNQVAAVTASQQGQKIAPGGGNPTDPKQIAALQKQLGLPPTGVYDAQTKNAVAAFQKAYGLKVDGIAGNQTLGTLHAARLLTPGQKAGGGKGRQAARAAKATAKTSARHVAAIARHNATVRKRAQRHQAAQARKKAHAVARGRAKKLAAAKRAQKATDRARLAAHRAETRAEKQAVAAKQRAARTAGQAAAKAARTASQQQAASLRASRQQATAAARQAALAVRQQRAMKLPGRYTTGVARPQRSSGRLRSTIH